MNSHVESSLTNLSSVIEQVSRSLRAIPAAEHAFITLASEIRKTIGLIKTTDSVDFLNGTHQEQNVINLINRMNGKPEEDLSFYSLQKQMKSGRTIDPHISFEEIKHRASLNCNYIVTENYVERIYSTENKYWKYIKKLKLSKSKYLSCDLICLTFLNKPTYTHCAIFSEEEFDLFYKDLGIRCIKGELGSSESMFNYVEKYRKNNSPTEEEYEDRKFYFR